MSNNFFDFLETPGAERTEKPRESGQTMVMTRGFMPEYILKGFSDYIDTIKLLERVLWAPDDVVREQIETYQEYDIDVQLGGLPAEIARLNNQQEEFMREIRNLGVEWIEYETHVDNPTDEEIAHEIGQLKDQGFRVVGEVGAKWIWNDPTRRDLDEIDVDRTIERIERFNDAGCEKVFWEGLIVRNLIGKQLDNKLGQKQLLEVAETVGHENLVFEMWGPGLTQRECPRFWAWLVYQFGPNVNVANVTPTGVLDLESVRRGMTWDMDHPYIRWLDQDKPTENWWKMEAPPYDLGLEKDP